MSHSTNVETVRRPPIASSTVSLGPSISGSEAIGFKKRKVYSLTKKYALTWPKTQYYAKALLDTDPKMR